MRRRIRAFAISLLLFACGGTLHAQAVATDTTGRGGAPSPCARPQADTASWLRGDWLFGGSFGVPGADGQPEVALFTVGFNWTRARPGRLGADFALGTMPRALAEGVLVLGFRGGVALPVEVMPRMLVLPSAGVSLIGAVAHGGGGATSGFNAGVATVLFGEGSVGLRSGVTWHAFEDARRPVWLFEVGVVSVR